ncbi:MAG: T9SS type A sorting domain-containing protein [Flavobacteriales bacterium]|nr:T9SS type A sorting domain-containing protein [Flavobacteriales bacterium]
MRNFRIHITCIVLAVGFTETALAQNWALLNPAYRYNYSNDGTDTISNQIRVMDVDTLGVDSFRYELNKVAERCIGCADGCNIRVNLPQFLQRASVVSNDQWLFSDTNQLVIRSRATLGVSWLFDPMNGTMATITNVTQEPLFGTMDSVNTLTTTLNDTVKWSKDHGIVLFHIHTGLRYELIGIQGPGLGQVVPSLEQFYRYQPGDVVQFSYSIVSSLHPSSREERLHISQRTELPGRLEFTGYSYNRHVDIGGRVTYSFSASRNWNIDITSGTGPMVSAPDELVNLGSNSVSNNDPSIICKHRINENGYYVIKAESFGSTSMFYLPDSLIEECNIAYIPILGYSSNLVLDNQLGLRLFSIGYGSSYNSTSIRGAIINGDTIGIVSSDDYFNVHMYDPPRLRPNPASDQVQLPQEFVGKELSIFDLQGRLVQSIRPTDSSSSLDVRSMQVGVFLLRVDGTDPQRLVIAR